MDVSFQFGSLAVKAKFNDSNVAQVIYSALPIHSKVNRWGDEIYFEIPEKLPLESGTLNVKIGDIGYWPEGACLCLFFGKTPASIDECPRPASEVTIVGTFTASLDTLRKVVSGIKVQVLKG
ncbi:MAG: hypothetical protein A3C35_06740 [Omnitrophica bacterium RIFCSPHIGHO2_02_FULL_46_11]|nr:MAG: hypothetical protein A3C35_06740 [Omnitrophica bacterium RIFCSPHIGHO2_02_FULL_46_11]OGW86730.1 MAG: hypothetical protein A3A81_08640 [Omnitrophica bacterium RIFCSPLOWO2_01_FULL_45_10b]